MMGLAKGGKPDGKGPPVGGNILSNNRAGAPEQFRLYDRGSTLGMIDLRQAAATKLAFAGGAKKIRVCP
jgi:hypothetical protein